MKRVLILLLFIIMSSTTAFAAKIPDAVRDTVKKDFAKADFRFDGLITLPDGTIYLPLYPALVKKPPKIEVRATVPEGKKFADEPDIVVFNNDFVLLKIITDQKGRKTVINMREPLVEVRTGLLPQDMLVPSGLIIPDSVKGIIGNLQIPTATDVGLKIAPEKVLETKTVKTASAGKNLVAKVPQLQNKTMYIATCYSKNIQVVRGESDHPDYALAQPAIPVSLQTSADEKFLLVSLYGKTFVNVISLADDRVIRQIDLTTEADEIVVDKVKNKAYVSSSDDSSIYIIDLNTMTLKQKIKVKGKCQKLYLTDDGSKLFFVDKLTNNIWLVELNNDYIIKNIGSFPNVSKIAYAGGKIYLASRTKNRVAIIDYVTLSLVKELDVESKPIDMLTYKDKVYVLSAEKNTIQVVSVDEDVITDIIYLNTAGFSTKICKLKNSNIALVMDTRTDKYSVVNLDLKQVIKTDNLEIPVSDIVIVPTVKKISK